MMMILSSSYKNNVLTTSSFGCNAFSIHHRSSVTKQHQHQHQQRSKCAFLGNTLQCPKQRHSSSSSSSSSLRMVLGADGGILGVGAPEIAVILLVGYFILGPTELYKLTKDIGKFVQNFRTLGAEASKSFENTMESQLELKELRKAQRELNDAFSFRRSINTDEYDVPFADNTKKEDTNDNDVDVVLQDSDVMATTTTKKKKKRRRVKKRIVEQENVATPPPPPTTTEDVIPDLDMTNAFENQDDNNNNKADEWYQTATTSSTQQQEEDSINAATSITAAVEKQRFANQLSGNWNQAILANEEELSPLTMIMERLAILEEEKQAADALLEEEFRSKMELEEKFYREKRDVLEQAAAEVQANVYGIGGSSNTNDVGVGEEVVGEEVVEGGGGGGDNIINN